MSILLRGRLNIGSHITTIMVVVMGALAVACSASDDDTIYLGSESELPLGHNVAIMVSGSCSTRTQIDPSDLESVMWSEDDQIALWAMEESSSQFSFEAVPLSLYYYGSEYNSAVFTGNVPEQSESTYTYAATYPLPTTTNGNSVTLTLPATQSGYYDGAADLMFGRVEGQAALTDDALRNGNLEFNQLTHAIRIDIPENRDLLGATTKLQVTFPEAVVGNATLNLTDENPAITLSNSSNSIYVDFDQVISEAGYVWIFIAPTTMSGEIEFVGYDKDNIPSQVITTTLSQREMAAGHITPITLTIPDETHRSIVLTIAKNNLGEDVTSVTLTAPSGAYFTGDVSEIVIEPDEDGNFRFSYKASLYESKFKAEGIAVKYESKSAIVEGEPIMITDEHNLAENYIGCTVPYLFEEDFSLVASNSGDKDGTVTIDGYDIWNIGSHYQYWANTSVAIKAYDDSYTSTSFTNSTLTLSGISAIKEGFSPTLTIDFDAGWTANQSTASMKLTVGDDSVTIDDNEDASYDDNLDPYSAEASNISSTTSITWTTNASASYRTGKGHETVYIDNIKISIK